MLDAITLREILDYDPDTGVFRWRKRIARKAIVGKVAGTFTGNGYRQITIHGVHYAAHRLAFLYMTGEWPEHDVDHRDGNRANNRWDNLWPATRTENMRNASAPVTNTSGAKGVHWNKRDKRWQASIRHAGKTLYLGQYHSLSEAKAVRDFAARDLHGEFVRLQ